MAVHTYTSQHRKHTGRKLEKLKYFYNVQVGKRRRRRWTASVEELGRKRSGSGQTMTSAVSALVTYYSPLLLPSPSPSPRLTSP